MRKCFITGGAGFIGSHLVEACLAREYHIVVLDDLSTGRKKNLPLGHPRLEFIEGDITNRNLLCKIREQHPDIEYVFHLAAIASVTRSLENPVGAHKVNFEGTLLLLETFKAPPVKKMLYASSAAVYGEPQKLPLQENVLPGPLSPYGADKLAGEYYLKMYNDLFNLPTISCRFFNVFGERQDPTSPYSGVISIFFDKVLAQKKGITTSITVYGDGQQTRDFIYVRDLVNALLFLAEHHTIRGEVFNLGYGTAVRIIELAQKIKSLLGADMPVEHAEGRPGDIRHSLADVSKFLLSGFAFGYSVDEGLARLAAALLREHGLEK